MERARVITAKKIRLDQLAAELGTDQVFSDVGAILAEVPQATLDAAVAAHIADDYHGEPAEIRDMASVRAKARNVFTGTDTFTVAQMQKIVAALVLTVTRRDR